MKAFTPLKRFKRHRFLHQRHSFIRLSGSPLPSCYISLTSIWPLQPAWECWHLKGPGRRGQAIRYGNRKLPRRQHWENSSCKSQSQSRHKGLPISTSAWGIRAWLWVWICTSIYFMYGIQGSLSTYQNPDLLTIQNDFFDLKCSQIFRFQNFSLSPYNVCSCLCTWEYSLEDLNLIDTFTLVEVADMMKSGYAWILLQFSCHHIIFQKKVNL